MLKKLLFFIFCLLSSIFISTNVEANDLRFCKYNENINLALPVTINVEIEATHIYYPFSQKDILYYDLSYFVYDKYTCENDLPLPYIDENEYIIISEYYYQYNQLETPIDSLIKKGIYSEVDLTPPVFDSPTNKLIANVDEYITLDKISTYIFANDIVDGKLIPEIAYDNYSDNFNVIGNYTIIFQACDKSNNCSNYDFIVEVIDITPPIIQGKEHFSFPLSKSHSIGDIAKNLTAIDNYDGNLTHLIYSTNHNYIPNKPGTYYAYFSVKDSSNNETISPFKVSINVYDDIIPVIEGPTNFTSPLSSILETKTILSNMVVSDNYDSNIYSNLYIIDDNYTKNNNHIGEYTLVLGCYDNNGNEALPYVISIKVIDDIAPTITGKTTLHSFLSSPLTLSEITSNFIVMDNYDGNIKNKLEIIEDNYTYNQNSIGVYNITFIVTDYSLNISSPFTVEIIVYDDISPIIEGESFYTTLITQKLNINNILLSLSAYDNIDGDISDSITLVEDAYSDNYNIPGTYFITFNVSDSSHNISTNYKIKIIAQEELTQLQLLNNSYISIDTSIKQSDENIFNIIGLDYANYIKVTTLENDYSSNYNQEGQYTIKYQLEDVNHQKEYLTLNINTYNNNETPNNNYLQKEKKETIFNKIISFFITLFKNITGWFKNLFS